MRQSPITIREINLYYSPYHHNIEDTISNRNLINNVDSEVTNPITIAAEDDEFKVAKKARIFAIHDNQVGRADCG